MMVHTMQQSTMIGLVYSKNKVKISYYSDNYI